MRNEKLRQSKLARMKKRAKACQRRRKEEEAEKSLTERKKRQILDSLKPRYTKAMNDRKLALMNAEPASINPLEWFRKIRRKSKEKAEAEEAEKKEVSG